MGAQTIEIWDYFNLSQLKAHSYPTPTLNTSDNSSSLPPYNIFSISHTLEPPSPIRSSVTASELHGTLEVDSLVRVEAVLRGNSLNWNWKSERLVQRLDHFKWTLKNVQSLSVENIDRLKELRYIMRESSAGRHLTLFGQQLLIANSI